MLQRHCVDESCADGQQETQRRRPELLLWRDNILLWFITLVIKHDVLRFEVSVNYPIGVKVTQGHRDLS